MFDLGVYDLRAHTFFVFETELKEYLEGKLEHVIVYMKLHQPTVYEPCEQSLEYFDDPEELMRLLKLNDDIRTGSHCIAMTFCGRGLSLKQAGLRGVVEVEVYNGDGGIYHFFNYNGQKIRCK